MSRFVALASVLRGAAALAALLALTAAAPGAPAPEPDRARAVPAFPGAEGGGALARGGRGGAVLEVTTLADAGPGSLRACIEAAGPRTCVFRVAGTILLRRPLEVFRPYLTVAGQTAPGGGIQLVGPFSTGDPASPENEPGASALVIATHDVVVRFLRIRRGLVRGDLCGGSRCDWRRCRAGDRQGGACEVERRPDALSLWPVAGDDGAVRDVILDHVSAQWSEGKAFGAWNNAGVGKLRDVTIQWCLAAESLKAHSTSLIVGSDNPGAERTRAISNSITDFDWHHDLTMSSSHRHPLVKAKRARFVNNIVYGWGLYATQIGGGAEVDVVANRYVAGPMTGATHEIQVYPWTANSTVPSGDASIHLAGNVGPHQPDPSGEGWGTMTWWIPRENALETEAGARALDGGRYRRGAPLPPAGVPISVARADAALEASILAGAGASRRLDCRGRWVDARDPLDRRLVEDVRRRRGPRDHAPGCTGPGCLPQSELDAPEAGFPALAAGAPCPDRDHDGMPDAWERARGLDPRDPADGARVGADGYTKLERYLAGDVASAQAFTSRRGPPAPRAKSGATRLRVSTSSRTSR